MEKEFPYNNWYLRINEDNVQFICDYVINVKPGYKNTWEASHILNIGFLKFNRYDKVMPFVATEDVDDLEEISFEDFKKHVLFIEEFVLPEKWCVYITDKTGIPDEYISPEYSKYYAYSHVMNGAAHIYKTGGGKMSEYTEITFEQFEKYVINKEEQKEDYSYLIPFFKKLNIS